MIKDFIKNIFTSMQGIFIPKNFNEDKTFKELNDSLKELEYYGAEHDKKNIKKDISAFSQDFNKATREAKIKFEPLL